MDTGGDGPPTPRTDPELTAAADSRRRALPPGGRPRSSGRSPGAIPLEGNSAGNADVVDVETFAPLQVVDDPVRERRGDGLVRDFDRPRGDDRVEEAGACSRERDRDEDGRVEAFADDRRADRPGPEKAAARRRFHALQNVGVRKLAHDVGGQRGEEDAPGRAEDVLVRLLLLVKGRRGQRDGNLDCTHREQVAAEAEPDNRARRAEAVDLAEHVAEEIREGEDHEPRREDAPGDLHQLDRDDVRNDEGGDEERRERDETPRTDHASRSNASSISSSVIVSGGVALMTRPSSPAGTTRTPRSHARQESPSVARSSPAPRQPAASKRSPAVLTWSRSSGIRFRTTSAAAQASGLPMWVCVYTASGPSSHACACSWRTRQAESGRPPPSALPQVMTS